MTNTIFQTIEQVTDETSKLDSCVETTLDTMTTTSSKIRYLASQGMARAEIAKKLGVRYQHVRNVLTTPLKSN